MIFKDNIEKLTVSNNNYRQVICTTKTLQLVLMSLPPKEEIGMEMHKNITQFFRIEKGHGIVIVKPAVAENKRYNLRDGDSIVIPPATKHNIINTSSTEDLKLYTIYAPPNHPPNTKEKVKMD